MTDYEFSRAVKSISRELNDHDEIKDAQKWTYRGTAMV